VGSLRSPGRAELLLETIGASLAKTGGSQAALLAYRKAHPNDWQRRLTKHVVSDLDGVPKRRLLLWLRGEDAATVLAMAVVADGPGQVDDRVRQSLRTGLGKSRLWRRHSVGRQRALEDAILGRILGGLLGALDASTAVSIADQRQTQRMGALARDLASVADDIASVDRRQALLTTSHRGAVFEQYLLSLPAPLRPALRALDERDPERMLSLVASVTDPSASPRDVLRAWRHTPPSWTAGSAQVMVAIAILCEQYLLNEEAIHWYEVAAAEGVPRRDYWIARAALLALSIGRGGDEDVRVHLLTAERLIGLLSQSSGSEPVVRVLHAVFAKDWPGTLAVLDGWRAEDPLDRTTASLEGVTARLSGEPDEENFWDEAITHLRDVVAAGWLPQVGLVLARLLNARVQQGKAPLRATDLDEAIDLGLRARDDFRAARQPSAVPLVEVLQAAGLASKPTRVLQLGTTWPDYSGEATEEEASTPAIVLLTLPAALQLGEAERIRARLDNLPAGYHRAAGLASVEAESPDCDPQAASRLWEEALAEAQTTEQRLRAWHALAELGDADLLGLREELGDSMPGLVTRLQAMAASASGLTEAAVQLLLPQRRTDVVAARLLATAYEALGQHQDAARSLLEAADDFHNPELALHAAFLLARSGDLTGAEAVANDLMADSFSVEGQTTLHMLRADLFSQRGHMQKADEALERALVLAPENLGARWGRTRVLIVRGRPKQAWECLSAHPGGRPAPRDESEARALLEGALRGQEDGSVFVREGLDQIEQFPESEGLAAAVLGNAMTHEYPLDDELRERLRRALQAFIAKWPESKALWQVTIPTDDVEEMRRALDSTSGKRTERVAAIEQIARQVSERLIPLSVLAWATGRTYTEFIVTRPIGVLIAEGPAEEYRLSVRDAAASLGHEVVCDITAMHVSAELMHTLDALRRALTTSHRAFLTSDNCLRDVVAGADVIDRASPGSWIPGTDEQPGYFHENDPTVVQREIERVHRLRARCQSLQAYGTATDASPLGKDLLDDSDAWQSALALAHARGSVLWSDDLPTRLLAREAGIAAFSTRGLIACLVDRGFLGTDLVDEVDRALVRLRVGDLPFSPQLLREVAQEEQWRCETAGQAWARPHSWLDSKVALAEFANVLRSVRLHQPEAVADWCFAGVLGATSVHYGLGPAIGQNLAERVLALAAHLVIDQPLEVARCVEAARLALQRSPIAVEDCLPGAVRLLRDGLATMLPTDSLTHYLTGAFSEASEEVQGTVRQALLT